MTLEKDSCLNFAIRGTVKVFRGLRSSSQITLCNNRNVPSPTQDKLLRWSDKRKCSIMWFLKKLTSLKFSSLIIVDNSCSLELPSCGWEKTIKCYIPRQTLFKKDLFWSALINFCLSSGNIVIGTLDFIWNMSKKFVEGYVVAYFINWSFTALFSALKMIISVYS